MSLKKIAVVCASGIGDALILHMVSHHLRNLDYEVTTFSNHLGLFYPWLQGYNLKPQPPIEQIEKLFNSFDAVFLQHDNSPKAKKIHDLPLLVYSFYGSHRVDKHGPLQNDRDFVCNPGLTMVENTLVAMDFFFGSSSKENGLIPPSHLIHRRFPKRIAIHPTSQSAEKNWSRNKFLQLAIRLKEKGYDPIFTVAPEELTDWEGPLFSTLGDLASFLYESGGFIGNDSGTGHLASYLNIPHVIIQKDSKQLQLWNPGWLKGLKANPPNWISHWRLLQNNWQLFVSKKQVLKAFNSIYS
jgi:hypothetical protein